MHLPCIVIVLPILSIELSASQESLVIGALPIKHLIELLSAIVTAGAIKK